MFLAKAVFDNTADTADELSFHRGDVVTVIERDIDGLEGWWLCAYKDKTGIAPGNRLRELAGMHGAPDGGRADSADEGSYSTPPKQKGTSWNRRSWAVSPDRVLTPQKMGNVYVYDQPAKGVHDYDVPPSRYFPAERSKTTPERQHSQPTYDIPTAERQHSQPTYDIPTAKSNNKNHETPNSSKGNIFSAPATDYDVPTSHFLTANDSVIDDPVSNRSSTASIFSTGSTATASSGVSNLSPYGSSAPPSSCGSERASWDLSGQDLYDVPPPPRTITQQPKRSPSKSDIIEDYDTPKSIDKSQADYDTPRSIDYTDSPKKSLDTSIIGGCDYDTPPSLKEKMSTHQKADLCNMHESERTSGDSGIDTSHIDIYDFPPKASDISMTEDIYSIPSNAPIVKPKLKDATNAKAFRSVGSSDAIYDVPPQVTRDSAISVDDSIDNRLSMCSSDSRGSDAPPVPYEELKVYRDVAMETLVLRLQNLQKATSKILGFVTSTWRKQESLKLKLFEIKAAFQDIERTLLEFVEFGQGALANSAKAEDKKLIKKMAKQLDPLQDALQVIKKCIDNLESARWQITSLASDDGKGEPGDDLNTMVATVKDIPLTSRTLASLIQGNSTLLFRKGPSPSKVGGGVSSPSRPKPPLKPKPKSVSINKDDATTDSRPLPELPSTNRPLPPVPNAKSKARIRDSTGSSNNSAIGNDYDNDYENDVNEWAHDYDYVQLTPDATVDNSSSFNFFKNSDKNSCKNNMLRGQSARESEVRDQTIDLTTPQVRTSGISDKFRENLERLQQDAKQPVEIYEDAMAANTQRRSSQLHEYDKQILVFYAAQVDTHSTLLVNASDAFFQCVDYNQPPKVFIAHSKFVILAAHKMVYIGDTLSRNVMSQDVRCKIMTCANHLCDCLKLGVTATKSAALQYPCLQAVQDMVDCTVEVTHAADELRIVIKQASEL